MIQRFGGKKIEINRGPPANLESERSSPVENKS